MLDFKPLYKYFHGISILVSSSECPARAQWHTEMHQMGLLSNLRGQAHIQSVDSPLGCCARPGGLDRGRKTCQALSPFLLQKQQQIQRVCLLTVS